MLKRIAMKSALVIGALIFAWTLMPGSAQARFFVGVGIGAPFYAPWPYYYGPPAVVYPPPAVYAPPAGYPPAAYVAPSPRYWYYCDDRKGYYPYVNACPTPWRAVPATPPAGGR